MSMPCRKQPPRARTGFTLIEMLVVLTIVAVLATLLVALAPRFEQQSRAARGAEQLQGWLLNAKSMAKREGHPVGVRLLPSGTTNLVSTLQYIEQPDDFIATPGADPVNSPQIRRIYTFTQNGLNYAALELPGNQPPPVPPGDFSGGFQQSSDWPVQAGDYLEFFGGGQVHRIIAVQATVLQLVSAPANTISQQSPTAQYRIIRAPRVLKGEDTLQMPQSVAIDLNTNSQYGYGPPQDSITNNYDILFSPSGAVILRAQTNYSSIILWVRDTTRDSILDGEPTLVTTYVRTGFIAAHPVNTSNGGNQPFSFALDGRSSGM
jgi:prepilin-type N-terminal cleavage/methylation domain-containing protein